MQAVIMDPEFHKHDPTHMLRCFSILIQKCPGFAGFWGLDNKVRMRMLSNLIVRYIYSAQTQKNKKRMLYIRLLIIYLKKNFNITGKLNAGRIAEMVYDLTIQRYKAATRVYEE